MILQNFTLDMLAKPAILGATKDMPPSILRNCQRFFVPYNLTPPSYTEGWYLGPLHGKPLTSELLGGSLDTTLLCFVVKGALPMSPSTAVPTTAVRESSVLTPAPVRHYWELFATDGPADLYRGFAIDAVDEFLKTQGHIEEQQFNRIMEAVNIAVDVALRAAHVPDSWLPQYEAALSAAGVRND